MSDYAEYTKEIRRLKALKGARQWSDFCHKCGAKPVAILKVKDRDEAIMGTPSCSRCLPEFLEAIPSEKLYNKIHL